MNGPVMAASASSGHESVFASPRGQHHHPELEQLAATMPTASIDTSTVRSQSRMSISHAKGLLNRPGQNNCFMNSAVQVSRSASSRYLAYSHSLQLMSTSR